MVVVGTKISDNKVKKYKANMNRVILAQCGVDKFFAFFTLFLGARSERAPHLLLHLDCVLALTLPWPRRL